MLQCCYRTAVRTVVSVVGIELAMFLAILWIIGLAPPAAAATPTEPGFTCRNDGRRFSCTSIGAEDLDILPRWTLHTKPTYTTYGLDFPPSPAPMAAPDRWTVIEMRTAPNDQSEAPYDGVVMQVARSWVRRCGAKAVFAPYHPGVKPPACPQSKP